MRVSIHILVIAAIMLVPCLGFAQFNQQPFSTQQKNNQLTQQNSNQPLFSPSAPGIPPDPTDTPIDGGLIFLIMAGVVYGIKRMKNTPKLAHD